jgi:hypothetical protein
MTIYLHSDFPNLLKRKLSCFFFWGKFGIGRKGVSLTLTTRLWLCVFSSSRVLIVFCNHLLRIETGYRGRPLTSAKIACDNFRVVRCNSWTMKAAMKWLALQNRSSLRLWAVVCLVLFVTLQLFADSGTLHKAIHPDANTPGHHCVINLIAQGHIGAANVSPVWIGFAAGSIFFLLLVHAEIFSSPDRRLSPSRAPPRF